MGALTGRKHKLQSHSRLQVRVYFILSSSCAVADRVLIKSESHSGSANIQWLRIPACFSASPPPLQCYSESERAVQVSNRSPFFGTHP